MPPLTDQSTQEQGAAQVEANRLANAKLGGTIPGSTLKGYEPTAANAYKELALPGIDTSGDQTKNTLQSRARQGALATVDEGSVYQNQLNQYQKEIDATNKIYGQILADTQQQGLGRLGSSRAIQSRGGLLGSDFGAAQTDTIGKANLDQENLVRAEQSAKIGAILGKVRQGAAKEVADKRAAQKLSTDEYLAFQASSQERKTGRVNALMASLIDQGIDVKELSPAQLSQIAKDYGIATNELTSGYVTAKKANEAAEAKHFKDNSFDLSEGSAKYVYDPATGKTTLVASRAKTYAPTSDGDGGGDGGAVSPAAQNILNLMNTSGGTVDDYIKGTSKESQNLRNEVYAALSGQGGVTGKSTQLFTEAKAIIDDMVLKNDYKKFGYSSKLGGQFTTGFGDMVARAATVNAILARDNLGLLKGAMSDKDVAFIQAMSAGVPEGTISEQYAKERIDSIQKKINEKVNQYTPTVAPMTPEERQQLISEGINPDDGSL